MLSAGNWGNHRLHALTFGYDSLCVPQGTHKFFKYVYDHRDSKEEEKTRTQWGDLKVTGFPYSILFSFPTFSNMSVDLPLTSSPVSRTAKCGVALIKAWTKDV
jgi:hypothetical protein